MSNYLSELADLPPINSGVGWYWTRCGWLAVLRIVCPDIGDMPLLGHTIEEDGFNCHDWTARGGWLLHRKEKRDLVLFIGPDRPEQTTYDEWRAAQEAEAVVEPEPAQPVAKQNDWWLIVRDGQPTICFDTQRDALEFYHVYEMTNGRIVHVREVSDE